MADAKFQMASVPIIGGADLRTDPMRVQPPKVLVAQDAQLDVPGRYRKRYGTRARASLFQRVAPGSGNFTSYAIRDPRWVTCEPRTGRVIMGADGLLLAESDGRWFARGALDQVRVDSGPILPTTIAAYSAGDPSMVDAGQAGDVQLIAWPASIGPNPIIVWELRDANTGTILGGPFRLNLAGGSVGNVRVLACDATGMLYLFWTEAVTSLKVLPIVVSSVRTHLLKELPTSRGTTLATDVNAVTLFDVCLAAGNRPFLAYVKTGGDIVRMYLDTAGNIDGAPVAETPGATLDLLAVGADATGKLCVAWGATTPTIKARQCNADLSADGAVLQLSTDGGHEQLVIGPMVDGWWMIANEIDSAGGSSETWNRQTKVYYFQPASSLTYTIRHGGIVSKPWQDPTTGRYYIALAYQGSAAQTCYLVYAIPRATAFSASAGVAAWIEAGGPVAQFWSGTALGVAGIKSYVTGVSVVGRKALLPFLYVSFYKGGGIVSSRTIRLATVDHASAAQAPAVPGPDASYAPGGILWRIAEGVAANFGWTTDAAAAVGLGGGCSEAGFLFFPEQLTAASNNTGFGGLVVGKSYSWRAYYRDITTGERSTAIVVTLTLAAANDSALLKALSLQHTWRNGVVVDWYRQPANAAPGEPYRYVGSAQNTNTGDLLQLVDTMNDGTLLLQPPDYLSEGEADEVAPEANGAIAIGDARAALAGFDDDGVIFLSKLRDGSQPVRWSDLLTARADQAIPGPITAMAWNGSALVVWRARSIQVLAGRGPNNDGSGSVPESALTVSQEIGCQSARALVRIPGGWIFQSLDGAYWGLSTSYELTPIGADVLPLNEPCLGAYAVLGLRQARFVTAQRTLVLHWESSSWTVWTQKGLGAAGQPDGTGLWIASAGVLLAEDPTSRTDAGVSYPMRVVVPWFRPPGVQGEIAVRRVLFAGGYEGPHRPCVRVAYDYEPGYNESYLWKDDQIVNAVTTGDGVNVFGGASRGPGGTATQVYQFSVDLGRERCQSVSLIVEDGAIAGIPLDASFWISDVAIEWAPVTAPYRIEERRRAEAD